MTINDDTTGFPPLFAMADATAEHERKLKTACRKKTQSLSTWSINNGLVQLAGISCEVLKRRCRPDLSNKFAEDLPLISSTEGTICWKCVALQLHALQTNWTDPMSFTYQLAPILLAVEGLQPHDLRASNRDLLLVVQVMLSSTLQLEGALTRRSRRTRKGRPPFAPPRIHVLTVAFVFLRQ